MQVKPECRKNEREIFFVTSEKDNLTLKSSHEVPHAGEIGMQKK